MYLFRFSGWLKAFRALGSWLRAQVFGLKVQGVLGAGSAATGVCRNK